MVDPDYPELVLLTCIPYTYHSIIDNEFIKDKQCFGIRLDTNYYFHITDLVGEENKIRKWLNANYKEKMNNVKREEY